MSDLLQLLEQPYNIVYSLFILVAVGIWLITVVGFISMSALDGIFDFAFDADIDHDVDLDHDLDLDHDADLSTHVVEPGFFVSMLGFVGVGKVPVTLIVTVLMFLQGILGLVFNYYLFNEFSLSQALNWLVGIAGFVLTFFVALYSTAYIMRPLYPFFQDYGKAEKSANLVGKAASITSGKATLNFGQAKIKLDDGDSVEVTVRCTEGFEAKYGERVLVVDYDAEKNIYYIAPYQAIE